MKTLYAVLSLALLAFVGGVNWRRARARKEPTSWLPLLGKSVFEAGAAILLGIFYPPLLVGLAGMWLCGDRFKHKYVAVVATTILASCLTLASKKALELLVLVGALALDPLTRLFGDNFSLGLARARQKCGVDYAECK